MCSACSGDYENPEVTAVEEPTDELDRALHLAYEAYMRGLYRESIRKNNELLWKAMGL